jgi:hypothetical protein
MTAMESKMINALFAFESREAGQQAADDLQKQGFAAGDVHVYSQQAPQGTVRKVDEQVSGGLVSNVLDLFQGIFDWGSSPHNAAPFEETVRRGGVVVGVNARDADEQRIVDERMQAAGCDQRSDWLPLPSAR